MSIVIRAVVLFSILLGNLAAQTTATIEGTVTDPGGAPVPGVRVRAARAMAGFAAEAVTDDRGAYRLANLPFQDYELTATAPGFAPFRRIVSAPSLVPVHAGIRLEVASERQAVTVAEAEYPLAEPERTGSYAQMNRAEIDRLSLGGNRGLEAALVSFPGFAQNANGAIHPRGAHNQMSFVVDGMPVSDQLGGAFANAIDPNAVQTVELYTGNIPAEFGSKVSAVANVTTRSGLGSGRPLAGAVALSGGGFDTLSQVTHVSGERGKTGFSGMFHSLKTHRYLDSVSLENSHNGGHSHRGFGRLDWLASPRDTIRLSIMAGNADFQLANLRSQQAVGMRQRQTLGDGAISFGWVRSISAAAAYDTNTSIRTSSARLLPSPADIPVTASQERRQSAFITSHRVSVVRGAHQIRAGGDFQRFPVRERFDFRVTDWPDAPAHLLPFRDATFRFDERAAGSMYSGWMQDQTRWGRFRFTLGARWDAYRFLVRGNQFQPRVGASYTMPGTGTVLRASYNRTYQTPPTENLLLSNSRQAAPLVDPFVRAALGGVYAPIRPERQDFYEAGFQQPLFGRVSVQGAYYHKEGRDQQDINNFLNTPIVFPTSLARIRVNGAEGRIVVPRYRGFSGTLSMTHARAITTPPFTGGLFIGNDAVALLGAGPFVIDHDQKLSAHGVLHWDHRAGWFATFTTRYDSGLVINPSDPAEVAADPDYSDLLPYIDLGADPARTRPRTVVDTALGYRRTGDGDRTRWEVTAQAANLTDRTAVYTFQSLFTGTRVVQPRTLTLRMKWYF